VQDLKVALAFLTRLPVHIDGKVSLSDLTAAVHLFPLVGALVGLIGALAFGLGKAVGLGSLPAALFAVAAMVVATGALHEDGLADTADALGAQDRERALAIMRDSRIGSFGTIALVLVLIARIAALSSFWDPWRFAAAMIAAAGASRALLPLLMTAQPPARADGLGAAVGRPEPVRVLIGLGLGAALALALLPLATALSALLAAACAAALAGWFLGRRFGGFTGDTLGAVQQLAEIAFLFAVLAHA
jgi:adenosylcobinamide-GDP ribazoletransferase